ncbi:hypothetical protein AC249_AIPGENE28983 [Exaiptasia diaphana]|nr:hypothetical protein AC249_AIPGENE28983 [Exaiptasia diaphana]
MSVSVGAQNFLITPNTRLVTSCEQALTAGVRDVTSQLECALWCLRVERPSCKSFNLEKQPSSKQGRKCELLSVDGNERRDLLKDSDDFDHFHLMFPNCGESAL